MFIKCYNFITAWYFLGIEGFPSNAWFVIEILTELYMMVDFLIKIYLKLKMADEYRHMWLILPEKMNKSKMSLLLEFFSVLPYSFVFSLAFHN